MKYLIYFLLILIFFGVNAALAAVFNVKLLLPSLIFILVLNFAASRNSREYFFAALAAGLLLDFYSRVVPGSFTVAFLAVAYAINSLLNWVAVLEINWKFLLIAMTLSLSLVYLAVWFYSVAAVSLHWTQAKFVFQPRLTQFIAELCVNLLLVLPVFSFLDWFKAKVDMAVSKQQTAS